MFNFDYLILLIAIILLSNCEEKPIWMNEDFDITTIKEESLFIDKMTINDNLLIKSKADFIKIKGKPKYIHRNCRSNKYDCWSYENELATRYYVSDSIASLNFVDFSYCNCSIQSPQLTLSKNTSLSEVKELFPIAYSMRNFGVDDPQYKEFVRLHLIDGLDNEFYDVWGTIILRFKDDKLANFEYSPPFKYNSDTESKKSKNFDDIFNYSKEIIIDTIY